MRLFLFLLGILAIVGCENKSKEEKVKLPEEHSTLFEQLTPQLTGVEFRNDIREDKEFNYLRYSYMYNGGGVAAGDFNNDGLPDLYFSANQGSKIGRASCRERV